jgi:hypothetical protein
VPARNALGSLVGRQRRPRQRSASTSLRWAIVKRPRAQRALAPGEAMQVPDHLQEDLAAARTSSNPSPGRMTPSIFDNAAPRPR